MQCTYICYPHPNQSGHPNLQLTTAYPQALPFCMQTHHHLETLNLTFFWHSSDVAYPQNHKAVSKIQLSCHKQYRKERWEKKKKTYISTLALIVKSIMGIKPTSWVKSMKQVLIPRRAIISRITLMHRSHDEERNKEKREMVHARELNSQTDFPFGLIIPCTEWQLFHCRHLWLTQLAFLRVKTYFLSSPPHLFFNCWHKLLLQFASQSLPH